MGCGIGEAVQQNTDILSKTDILEVATRRKLVADTDIGKELHGQIDTLSLLLDAYHSGTMPQLSR